MGIAETIRGRSSGIRSRRGVDARSRLPQADVCLIVEGCYPFVPGGVSAWIDWLFRSEPDATFSVVTLWPKRGPLQPRYQLPANVVGLDLLYLQDFGAAPARHRSAGTQVQRLGDALVDFLEQGSIERFHSVTEQLKAVRSTAPLERLFNSPLAWEVIRHMYERMMPHGSFLHFFWAWRALLGGLFATVEFALPRASLYHTISTGYAGLLAARAGLETGRPVVLTEHGIYTNERRIEILMADWVADTVDKGHNLADARFDIRDMWMRAFEAYARACYGGCARITTLYDDNQRAQRFLGADPARLQVIANGIDVSRFAEVTPAGQGDRPTMALIGRVVPIKDVKTYITTASLLRERVPELRAWVLGPLDEDPGYVGECRALVDELGLAGCVEFAGAVNVVDYLSQIHVVVLSSLSESQPLVVLEAGAAGLPFVATNVGSCREILEGRPDEHPPLGAGGLVTNVVAPAEIADAVAVLLADATMRARFGQSLKARVKRYYTSEQAAAAYGKLYRDLIGNSGRAQSPSAAGGEA